MRILIVDSSRHGTVLCCAMTEEAYTVELATSGRAGRQLATGDEWDLIMVSDTLPDCDGVLFCREARERRLRTRIVVCCEEEVPGRAARLLDAGADGCMVQPLKDMEHTMAVIRAMLRRDQPCCGDVLRAGDIELDLARRTVRRAGKPIKLTRKEFELLHVLMRNPDRVISRSSIGIRVWGDYYDRESNVIDVCISNLRHKIDKDFHQPLIRTVRGSGYMLTTIVDEEAGGEPPDHDGTPVASPRPERRPGNLGDMADMR